MQRATQRYRGGVPQTQPAEAARALRDMLQGRRDDAQAIFGMMATLTSTLDLRRLLGYVVRLCAELTGCAGALVYLWDDDRERLVVRAGVEGYEQWVGRFSLAMGEGLTGWTALTRHPGIIRENPTSDSRFKSVPEMNDDRFQSYLTIPVISPSDRLLGVITMHTEAPHEFEHDDLILMNTLSGLIAVAIENAQLYGRQDRQVRVLHSLARASQAVVQTATLQHILYRLAATTSELVSADRCAVFTLDEGGTRLALETLWSATPEATANPPHAVPTNGQWAQLLGATTPVVLARREHREAFAAFGSLAPRARTVLVAPMRVSERVVGTFICFSESARSFGSDDRELLSMVASQAALAVQNARLIEALTERNVIRDLFDALMLGEEGDLGLEARAVRLGADLARPHVVAILEATSHPPDFDAEGRWLAVRQDLVGKFPGSLITYRDHAMTALIRLSDKTGVERLANRLRAMKAHHERSPELVISVGISRVCRRVSDYPDAFEQAGQALLMGRAVRGSGAVVPFDELGSQWYLFSIAQQQVRDSYQERLETLLEHDQAKGSQLFQTVEVYLECMGNAKIAAEQLFVHRNTLRQRIEKILRVTGLDLSEKSRWFDLMMALRIIRLREVAQATPMGDRAGAPPARIGSTTR
jgi:GAF domain-containing protein